MLNALTLLLALATTDTEPAAEPAPAAAPPPRERLGITTALRFGYFSADRVFNASGKMRKLSDSEASTYTFGNLQVGYDFSFGLFVGLDVPYVMHSFEVGGAGGESADFGDGSAFLGQRLEIIEGFVLTARGRLKGATGTGDLDVARGGASTGSGFGNGQLDLSIDGHIDQIAIFADLGYLKVFQGIRDALTTVDPGDFIYADLAVGYRVTPMIEPRLHFIVASQGETVVTEDPDPFSGQGGGSTTERGTGASYTALALDVRIAIDDIFTAHAGLGSPLDGAGYQLPYGFALTGKNLQGGWLSLQAGIEARF
jgi:hypothetical protein